MWQVNPYKPAGILLLLNVAKISQGLQARYDWASINYSDVKQYLGLWLLDSRDKQVSNQCISTSRSFLHNFQVPRQRSKVTKSIPNFIMPIRDQAPKATIKSPYSILNSAPQPSHTEGKENSG